jgi:glycerol kinase
MSFILALDQGTSSSKAIIFNKEGNIVSQAQIETTLLYPQDGWVEQDPEEIWNSQKNAALEAMRKANLTRKQIAAIGITNQRETTILWNRSSGKAYGNAIIWQDTRTSSICAELRRRGHESTIKSKTGLTLHPYFSATKMAWLIETIPEAKACLQNGTLGIGTVDTWLLYKLTQGQSYSTDTTNASRTMLYNIHHSNWDNELLSLFSIPDTLPSIQPSSSCFGEGEDEFKGIPIAGIAGDQHAALFGQCCFKEGMIKNTYGTGCFILMHTGTTPKESSHNLLTTRASTSGTSQEYALEGSIFIGGAAVQWIRDGLGIINSSTDIETLAKEVDSSGGIYFVPAFNGLGAPHWDTQAQGILSGIKASTNKAHIARATIESMAFQSADVITSMLKDAPSSTKELRVDGGASCNNLLLQFQSDLLDIPVIRPKILETTALGAAYLAGLAINYWSSTSEIESFWKVDRTFTPMINESQRKNYLEGWHLAVSKSKLKRDLNP